MPVVSAARLTHELVLRLVGNALAMLNVLRIARPRAVSAWREWCERVQVCVRAVSGASVSAVDKKHAGDKKVYSAGNSTSLKTRLVGVDGKLV